MNYFICDIIGTFDGAKENRSAELQRFVQNLHMLMEVENLDNLTFCFSTSEDMSEMKRNISELEEILKDTGIKTGPHFSYDEKLEYGKIRHTRKGKIYHAIEILKDKKVNNVYIADVSSSVQDVMKETLALRIKMEFEVEHNTLEGYTEYNKLVQFIPGSDDDSFTLVGSKTTSLLGLNDCLETYINKFIKQKTLKRID